MAFSFRIGTNWCHDFPKLARESGFYFNMHGSRVRVDWNRINAIDIDRMIRERDFSTIDENISNVIDYCLENEYDVKILDPNFVKLFRLAQLSVEYLLYCKQYLDHSVIILKDELRLKIAENANIKKEITTLEDTIKNLKERSKEKCKLIETRVGDSSGEIYKCPHCPKTFVSAMFVNAHVARRHSYISNTHISISPAHEHYRTETEKLHNEIKTLKERLNQTERVIRNDKMLDDTEKVYVRNISKDEYIMQVDKFQERKKYQEDIGDLKNMLFNEIRAVREKEHIVNESILEASVKTLIGQQEKEIVSLKNQLLERLTPDLESMQVKLQTQENYWKAKIEDMEAQHRRDIERLTTELKVTQQVADRMKSEYISKVHDLEKQSMDQSNILVEQEKKLNSLSREINNSQMQSNYKIKEKSIADKFHESSLLQINKIDDSIDNHNDNETYRKNLNCIKNDEIIIEHIDSESSQEYNDKLVSIAAQNKYMSNKKNTTKSKNMKKCIVNFNKTVEHAVAVKPNSKNLKKLEIIKKTRDKTKHYDISKNVDETNNGTHKVSSITNLENVSTNITSSYIDTKNIGRNEMFHSNDITNKKKFHLLEKHSVNSTTESESLSSTSQSESDKESVTLEDDVMVKYEMPRIKLSDIRNVSIQKDVQNLFDNRLRDLGIDPEWQGIPMTTFKQKMEIVKHQQNINIKKLAQYERIKQKILENVLKKISTNYKKELGHTTLIKMSPLNKVINHIGSKTLKAFIDKDNDEYISVQKSEHIMPSKWCLKQKTELPKKYKDDEVSEISHELQLKTNEVDHSSPKISMQSRLITDGYKNSSRDISFASSVENSPKNRKQISSTKITVSDMNAHKVSSSISRKQILPSKLPENNDSDSAVVQQEDSVISPKNKGVLKPTSGSVGSLVKKKVIFDLENEKDQTMISENKQRKNQADESDWNISSFSERGEYILQKEKSMSTGNIVLRTSQSDKIAEISKKIQEQLNIVVRKPPGSVETIFRSNTNLQDVVNSSTGSELLNSYSIPNSVLESPIQNFMSPRAKSSMLFPQPAPRTLQKDLNMAQKESLKYSDLESDIDEILQM